MVPSRTLSPSMALWPTSTTSDISNFTRHLHRGCPTPFLCSLDKVIPQPSSGSSPSSESWSMSTVPCTSNPIPNPHWWSTTPFLCSNTNPTGGKEDCASSLPLYTMPMCSGSHPTQIPLSRQHSDTSFDSNFPSTCNGSHSSLSTNPLVTPPSPLSTSMCSNSCQWQLDTRNEHLRMPPSRTASAIEHKGFVSSLTAHMLSSPQKPFVEYMFSLANDEGPVHPESCRLSPPHIMQPPTNEHSPNCNNSVPMHNIHSISPPAQAHDLYQDQLALRSRPPTPFFLQPRCSSLPPSFRQCENFRGRQLLRSLPGAPMLGKGCRLPSSTCQHVPSRTHLSNSPPNSCQ